MKTLTPTKVMKIFDESADKTDIWDSERYDKFRKIFKKELDKLAGDKLVNKEAQDK